MAVFGSKAGFVVLLGMLTVWVPERGAIAQNVTLDGTLGTAGTLAGPTYTIRQTDGTTLGNNLFHSFGRFNLNVGEIANFESAASVRNILARITGGSPSSIDGILQVSGSTANLFLMNPQGMLFGRNARLNVGGSFVATTAHAIQFGNQGSFSATSALPLPLLTVNPSALVYNQRMAAPIQTTSALLQVPDGQSLLLVGGNVLLDGSTLAALGGFVELGTDD